MNNEQRTFESFLDEWARQNGEATFSRVRFLGIEKQLEGMTEAAQRFAAWKARTTAIAFAEWTCKDGWNQHEPGQWEDGEDNTGMTEQLYETFSGLPVEQGQPLSFEQEQAIFEKGRNQVKKELRAFMGLKPDESISNAISDLQQRQKADGWISVQERLPEIGVRVLVYVDGIFKGLVVAYRTMDGFKLSGVGAVKLSSITHWQELPALPLQVDSKKQQ